MDYQFYPTPKDLARLAWSKFMNRDFSRILEPSAGEGHLLEAGKDLIEYHRRLKIDCCEIDVSRHAVLRSKGYSVVGFDFMSFGAGAIYSHIIMNPPFNMGAQHVLKAWNLLWDGEIVAIVNAETLNNPYSAERRHLLALIQEHGTMDLLEGAFAVEDAERKTNVQVALVYLRKKADQRTDIIGNLYDTLRQDFDGQRDQTGGFSGFNLPAIPNSTIENAVLAFNAAVVAMRESTLAQARENYYTAMLGETMANIISGTSTTADSSVPWVQSEISKAYDKLKDRAWAGILRSAKVAEHLSSSARARLESEFSEIQKLEFSVQNVYGFLCGLAEKQGEIQAGMACDVFDLFSRYHSENTVFYKGYKSNDRHRSCGMRLRKNRFILPGHSQFASHCVRHETIQLLRDIDKVFAMLDCKHHPEVSLERVFDNELRRLRHGERITSTYFDVRYYPGAGTIHFFPRHQELIDRLNRFVGQRRQWLPPEESQVSKAFWQQYDRAEKYDKSFRARVMKKYRQRSHYSYNDPLDLLVGKRSTSEGKNFDAACLIAEESVNEVLIENGIDIDFLIDGPAAAGEVPLLGSSPAAVEMQWPELTS